MTGAAVGVPQADRREWFTSAAVVGFERVEDEGYRLAFGAERLGLADCERALAQMNEATRLCIEAILGGAAEAVIEEAAKSIRDARDNATTATYLARIGFDRGTHEYDIRRGFCIEVEESSLWHLLGIADEIVLFRRWAAEAEHPNVVIRWQLEAALLLIKGAPRRASPTTSPK